MAPTIVVSGVGCMSDYAESSDAFFDNLKQKKCVDFEPVFTDSTIQEVFGFRFNPKYAPMKRLQKEFGKRYKRFGVEDPRVALMVKTTNAILQDAGLSRTDLADERTQVIWGAPGNQPDLRSFLVQMHSNDKLDLMLNPKMKELHVNNFRNDSLTNSYADYYQIKRPVDTVFSACSSSLSALVPSLGLLKSGQVDRVLILAWQEVSTFDILFMSGLNILAQDESLPFSQKTEGLIPAFGIAGVLLERKDDCEDRNHDPYFSIKSTISKRAFGSANSPSMGAPFRMLTQTFESLLEKSELTPSDIDAIFPHGNGIRASDQAEATALAQVFKDTKPAVANYTHQYGYMLASSGAFDLVAAAYSFKNQEILPFVSPVDLDDAEGVNFITDAPKSLNLNRMLKTSIGIDGSLVTALLESTEAA